MIIRSKGYNITLDDEQFAGLNAFLRKNAERRLFILCDDNTQRHCLPLLLASCRQLKTAEVVVVTSGEKNKTPETAIAVWQTLLQKRADRDALLLNLGGGMICD